VSGDPPVPITVWHVPVPPPGEAVSKPLADRLVHNFTHPGDLVIDATGGTQLARAIIAGGRRRLIYAGRHPDGHADGPAGGPSHPTSPVYPTYTARPDGGAALLVAAWPVGEPTTVDAFVRWASPLHDGGCLAVVLPHTDPTVHADLVTAARGAGLAYLQHVVAVTGSTARGSARSSGRGGHTRLRVHSDVLILTRPRAARGGNADA
jgi:hypothetical protein